MAEVALYLLGHVCLVLGGVSFVTAVLFTYLAICISWWSGKKYWEEKATLLGLIALFALPLGGIGGGLLLLCHIFYSPWREWGLWPFLLSTFIYAVFAVTTAGYVLFRSSLKLD